jgi:ribonuclease Z
MHPFEVTILGCSSATPTSERNPSAQVVSLHDRLFLVDCGEGTQIQIRKYKIKLQKLERIFISHLHGDHYLGLVGLLGTMHLLGRTKELHLYGPAGLKEIIEIQHKYSETYLRYNIQFTEIDTKCTSIIFEDEQLSISTIPLSHRVPCSGFLFQEKLAAPRVDKDLLAKYKIPFEYIHKIKAGDDFTLPDGTIIANNLLTIPPPAPRSYAYCSDTCYLPELTSLINNVNLLYHEATFTEELRERAKETFHSTAAQAAKIAEQAQVKQLVIGHFSARYNDLTPLLNEAQAIFNNTFLAIEGAIYKVPE